MTINVAISGFGRIGRCTLSAIIEQAREDIQVVRMNATGPIKDIAHLLKSDSIHGRLGGDIIIDGDQMDVGQGPMQMFSTYDPETLDWDGIDVVLGCSGQFNSRDAAAVHLRPGAKKVLVSAPAKNADRTLVFGVNSEALRPSDLVVSNGSCTTNCLAPLAKSLNDAIGIDAGIMTTVHSYTGDQPTLDRRHSDLYRARAAAMSLSPPQPGQQRRLTKRVGFGWPTIVGCDSVSVSDLEDEIWRANHHCRQRRRKGRN
ncbi:MAG: glyceraldehyde 3-phosphate dehydrogenase, partial [Paracoccaceae bacterium]